MQYPKASLPKISYSRLLNVDQLLLTLIKLRLDQQFRNLTDQFNLPKSSAHDIFRRWIDLLHAKLKFLIQIPDRDAAQRTLPYIFYQYFPCLTVDTHHRLHRNFYRKTKVSESTCTSIF